MDNKLTQIGKNSNSNKYNNVKLTNDQDRAIYGLLEFLNKPFDTNDISRALIGPAGVGKALTLDTRIHTPNGWVTMRDIKVGDIITSPFHNTTKVTAVYPQGNRIVYKVMFADGRSCLADGEHLWTVRTSKLIKSYRNRKDLEDYSYASKVMTTKELLDDMSNNPRVKGQTYRYNIPLIKAFSGISKDFIIDPYLMGILLGDGCLTTCKKDSIVLNISNDEADIIHNLSLILNCEYKLHSDKNYTNTLKGDSITSVNNKLIDYGLNCNSYDKFIPKEYLFASVEQRKNLLKGLIDSDGSVDSKGRIRISTTSVYLKNDIAELCRGLGYTVGIGEDNRSKYTARRCYIINIATNDIIFNSVKHLNSYEQYKENTKDNIKEYKDHLGIEFIVKYIVEKECQCISVDDPDKLYVIDDFLVTHNTFVIKYLIDESGYASSVVGLAAPTHKAARVLRESTGIKATTVQSDLGLRLNIDVDNFDINNPPFDPLSEKKIKGYKLYIIDEASMIGRNLKTLIERECRLNECKILYVGDASQLFPVRENFSPAFSGIKAFTLNQIVRQGDDNPISDLLQILRNDIRNKSYEFLNTLNKQRYKLNSTHTKGYVTLGNEQFKDHILSEFTDEEFSKNIDKVRLITYTNKAVTSWNTYIRHNIIDDANRSIITKHDLLLCYTTLLDEFKDAIITNSEDYIIKDVVNYTNAYGIKGLLVRFVKIHGGQITKPLFVVDHTDVNNITLYFKQYSERLEIAKAANKYNRVSAWKEVYVFKERNLLLTNILLNNGKIFAHRDLDYGFCISAHKSQGSTFDTVCVDINDIVFKENGSPYSDVNEINRRLYVAVSRCKNKAILSYGR